MKEKMQPGKLVPRYAVPWLLSALVWQLGLYFLAKLLTDGRFHYDLSISLDDKIPFVPFFMPAPPSSHLLLFLRFPPFLPLPRFQRFPPLLQTFSRSHAAPFSA